MLAVRTVNCYIFEKTGKILQKSLDKCLFQIYIIVTVSTHNTRVLTQTNGQEGLQWNFPREKRKYFRQ